MEDKKPRATTYVTRAILQEELEDIKGRLEDLRVRMDTLREILTMAPPPIPSE